MEAPKAESAKGGKGLLIGGAIAAVAVIGAAAVLLMGGKKEQAPSPAEQAAATQTAPAEPAKTEPAKPTPQAAAPAKKEAPKTAVTPKAGKGEEKTALLTINSSPSGAKAVLNGKTAGTTPITKKKYPLDRYELKLVKKGYAPYSEKFTLKEDLTISVTLKAGAGGKEKEEEKKEGSWLMGSGNAIIVVNSKPGDQVTVDGLSYTSVPVEVKNVVAGSHNIFVIRKGKKPFLKTVNVKPGETLRVTPEFK